MTKRDDSDRFLSEHQEWINHAQNPHYNLGKFDSFKRRQLLAWSFSSGREKNILFLITIAIIIFSSAVYLSSYLVYNIALWTAVCIAGIVIPLLLIGWSVYLYKHGN
jgi:hypothetical protein